jgi:P pilus assembly chaperone PapD
MTGTNNRIFAAVAAVALFVAAAPARADIFLSDLIVDLQSGKQLRDDVEVWNSGAERAYVAIEPREIVRPGTADETVRTDPDPEKLGLLVTPTRMVLEPGQRKIIRLASLVGAPQTERVYRVTVRPVVGDIESSSSGLKILVGYDVLVLVRPATPTTGISATRSDGKLTFTNDGNVSVELVDGRQCDSSRAHCTDLPGKRLYAGASWSEPIGSDLPVEYTVKSPGQVSRRVF